MLCYTQGDNAHYSSLMPSARFQHTLAAVAPLPPVSPLASEPGH